VHVAVAKPLPGQRPSARPFPIHSLTHTPMSLPPLQPQPRVPASCCAVLCVLSSAKTWRRVPGSGGLVFHSYSPSGLYVCVGVRDSPVDRADSEALTPSARPFSCPLELEPRLSGY